uniref:Mitochondrial ornithine transporter 1 n=1 Tax=Syphacia muris TaxID=451379 RepID=A0A0N5AY08_9BILA
MEQFEIETEYSPLRHVKDGIIDLTAGTLGGIANVYAGQPLDTIKVKMQTFPSLYKSAMGCFKETFRLDGIRGLYAGTVPALTANIAENAVLFTAYGFCQKAVAAVAGRSSVVEMHPIENATAGSLAAVFAATVLCPTELVKCRLQSQREMNCGSKSTPLSLCRQMWRTEGFRSFFVGMTPTLAREVPGYFFFFGSYEGARYLLSSNNKTKNEIGPFCTALAGGIGGMAFWAAIFPADVIKSRMQVNGKGNFVEMFKKIVREEGIRALYLGLSPTLLRTFSASACLFVAFEYSKKALNFLL